MTDPKTRPETAGFEETDEGKLRRKQAAHKLEQAPGEIDGRDGPEPTRYGDWERKGIISDF
ncbi:MAG: succinate dehydrogenase assembly factor 4 [Pseudomonadota bacterium]|nr:succinate dehydrogenase assembly factor 4 [Pseudomonadota bacterium]